jgi:hypothetical protein
LGIGGLSVLDYPPSAKERVRPSIETVTEDREVSEEVRKKQIATDGAEPASSR